MANPFGSEWNKWDFHVHTPYSILNNQYGFNPFDEVESGKDDTKKFDAYVKTLFSKAIENNIGAIGITDYFMVEGYKRIKLEYLEKPAKLAELFPDESIREKVKNIFVFPNVELRLDTFVGEKSSSVNYHVLFSNELPIQEIEENFLQELKFQPRAGQEKSLTITNLKNYGQQMIEEKGEKGSDLLAGLKNVAISYGEIIRVLKKNGAFEGKYLITVPVDEDLSVVSWKGRDYSTRKNLYEQCHCLLTSNKATAKWALAEGEEEERIKEFGSIKPCIWGSDAHDYDRMFHPENDRFCWIKAECSFAGLLQILYEPKERVIIQKDCPNEKDIHQIIKWIEFKDDNFQTTPIVFNDYLTCIIGGKSTGKSLLLQQLAAAIDPTYAQKQEEISSSGRKKFEIQRPNVVWKDGASDTRRIIYVPQTFLNRTIDNPEKSTAINTIIGDVLKQEGKIAKAYDQLQAKTQEIKRRVRTKIIEYCEKVEERETIVNQIKSEGEPESFRTILLQLEAKLTDLATGDNIRQENLDRYAALESSIKGLEKEQQHCGLELKALSEMHSPAVVIPGYFIYSEDGNVTHTFEKTFLHCGSDLQTKINQLDTQIQLEWKQTCEAQKNAITNRLREIGKLSAEQKKEYSQLKEKVEKNEQVQKISAQLTKERNKWETAKERRKKQAEIEKEISYLQEEILQSQQQYKSAYAEYCGIVASTGTRKRTSLAFDAKPVWKKEEFEASLGSVFNNRNFARFLAVHGFNLAELDVLDYGKKLLTELWTAMLDQQAEGSLTIKTAYSLETALQQLFGDWYNVHYIVKSGNDTIEEMSPGKKALVLLELLISLEDSKCPILIDQPEDDLDNRSIYDDLVQYIKEKKKERQIIIVTHNANVVLGADAEEIIIANQHGKDTENQERRFEYRSGAIENDQVLCDAEGNPMLGILNQRGIQTQICDILEGGPSAFELRKNKYMMVSRSGGVSK